MKSPYSYGRQVIEDEDILAVENVLRSPMLTQGPAVALFEQGLVDYCKSSDQAYLQALVVNSGTAGLHLCYQALGMGASSLLWSPAISFVATTNAALSLGAKVDFVDCEADTGLISIEALEAKLMRSKQKGNLPNFLVVVHLNGRAVDMQRLALLAKEYGFKIIEDACHALGAKLGDHKIGSGEFSEATIFSFHPVKSITCGEGGAVLTNNPELYQRMKLIRSHGIERFGQMPWQMRQLCHGHNFRLSDIHAALGASQLQRLDEMLKKRGDLAKLYDHLLQGIEGIAPLPKLAKGFESAHHLYPIRLLKQAEHLLKQAEHLLKQAEPREALMIALYDQGISVQVHYPVIYNQPYYQELGFKSGLCPNAEIYANQTLSLPLYPSLEEEDIRHIVTILKQQLDLLR